MRFISFFSFTTSAIASTCRLCGASPFFLVKPLRPFSATAGFSFEAQSKPFLPLPGHELFAVASTALQLLISEELSSFFSSPASLEELLKTSSARFRPNSEGEADDLFPEGSFFPPAHFSFVVPHFPPFAGPIGSSFFPLLKQIIPR